MSRRMDAAGSGPRESYRYRVLTAIVACSAALASLVAPARADQFHYVNTLIGDRASGMGGAYTALSDDATGLYYNPAGIIYASGRDLSVSANVYARTAKSYQGAIGRFDWHRDSSALLPNYFGMVLPAGDGKVGISYAVPDSSREDQDQIFDDVSGQTRQYVINFHSEDSTYNFGPTIAAPLRDDLSVGFTLYYFLRRWQYTQNEVVRYETPTYGWTNRVFKLVEHGVRPVLGVMWLPMDKASVGFTLSKVQLFRSSATQQDACSDTNADEVGCNDQLILNTSTVTEKRRFPVQTAVGAAYYVTPDLLVSGDVNYFSRVNDSVGGNRRAVANVALGTEYVFSKAWALQAGLFTDMANTADLSPDRSNQLEHVDLFGVSLSVRRFTRNTTLLAVGGSYAGGTGKAQIVGGRNDLQTLNVRAWTLFLTSSYAY